jgi:hypothetical protein
LQRLLEERFRDLALHIDSLYSAAYIVRLLEMLLNM